jgi:predicted metal-binding protein
VGAYTKKCEHPDLVRPAMEACGIDVYQTLRNVGISIETIATAPSAARYIGLILT